MLKNIICTLIGILLFSAVCAEAADKKVSLIINGKQNPVETQPFIRDGQVFVPVRFIAEELGAQVVWDDKNYSVLINKDQSERYLKGQNFSNSTDSGINNNLIKAVDLKDILDDDKDNDLADYREGHNGGDQLANDPLVVDLRKKEDYDTKHIPGAVWVATAENIAEAQNIQNLKSLLEKHVSNGGKNEIVVYCYTGNISGLVAGVLGVQELPVKNLMYGFDISWRGTKTAYSPIFAPMEDSNGQKHLGGG
ncbi:MAG TPA: sulfurtransferase [Bacteroidales bacterium]|nr:sulfurtransferase [Bacteroidales bacterium]